MAMDGYGDALTYRNGAWSQPEDFDPGDSLAGAGSTTVSCPTSNFCATVDSLYEAFYFDGRNWTKPQPVSSEMDGYTTDYVSCPDAQFCLVTNAALPVVVTARHDHWGKPIELGPDLSPLSGLTEPSCPTADFCAVTNYRGEYFTYNGTTWSSPQRLFPPGTAANVSCPTTTQCIAINSNGDAITLHGSVKSTPVHVLPASDERFSLSCPSTRFCVATEGSEEATFNGADWSSPVNIDPHATITSLSCPAVDFCAAVDDHGNAVIYSTTHNP